MITATTWVPRGFAAPFPTKYTFDEEEFKRIAELARLQLDDANEGLEAARNGHDDGDATDKDGPEGTVKEMKLPSRTQEWEMPPEDVLS